LRLDIEDDYVSIRPVEKPKVAQSHFDDATFQPVPEKSFSATLLLSLSETGMWCLFEKG
jgi:hypothetical protein